MESCPQQGQGQHRARPTRTGQHARGRAHHRPQPRPGPLPPPPPPGHDCGLRLHPSAPQPLAPVGKRRPAGSAVRRRSPPDHDPHPARAHLLGDGPAGWHRRRRPGPRSGPSGLQEPRTRRRGDAPRPAGGGPPTRGHLRPPGPGRLCPPHTHGLNPRPPRPLPPPQGRRVGKLRRHGRPPPQPPSQPDPPQLAPPQNAAILR